MKCFVQEKLPLITVAMLAICICIAAFTVVSTAKAVNLKDCEVTMEETSFAYTGKAIAPDVFLTHGSKALTEGSDYVVDYVNNVQPGKATLVIAGIHDYTGILKQTFDIDVAPARNVKATFIAPKKAKDAPAIEIRWKGAKATDHYVVEITREGSKAKPFRDETTDTAYRFEDPKDGRAYEIQVTAVAGSKQISAQPAETVCHVNPLDQPVIQAAAIGAGHIQVSWEPVENAQHYVITEISESNGDREEVTVDAAQTTARFMGKIKGNSYTYTVKATAKLDGQKYESPASASSTATAPAARIGQAAEDEHGGRVGGKAGDQTGKEVYVFSKWSYSGTHKKWNNWQYVARFKDPEKAALAAAAMEAACNNPHIGYDQKPSNGRGELKALAQSAGWDMSAITTNCEASCSPLVAACICCAGIDFPVPGGTSDSRFLVPLQNTGEFEILTDPKYTQSDTYLQQGDILVTPSKHTGMVL